MASMDSDRWNAEPCGQMLRPAVVSDKERAAQEQGGEIIQLNFTDKIEDAKGITHSLHNLRRDLFIFSRADKGHVNVLALY